jgi:hypothetical protein
MTARDKGRRLLDWFLVTPRAREVLAHRLDAEQKACVALARGADDLARSVASDPGARGAGLQLEGAILVLYAEAAYWALRAQLPGASRTGEGGLRALVERVGDPAIDERIGPGSASSIRETLLLSHDQMAALDAEGWPTVLERAACAEKKILEAAQAPDQAIRAVRAQRAWRIVAIPALFLLVVFYVASPRDLAHGKPWRASSAIAGMSSSGVLESTDAAYFFHTNNEANPSVTVDIDLHNIHKVVLTNRRDCCQDRAIPLVIETMAPGGTWRTVAQRDEPFTEWVATFPRVSANQVRVRATRTTLLHLADIKVY